MKELAFAILKLSLKGRRCRVLYQQYLREWEAFCVCEYHNELKQTQWIKNPYKDSFWTISAILPSLQYQNDRDFILDTKLEYTSMHLPLRLSFENDMEMYTDLRNYMDDYKLNEERNLPPREFIDPIIILTHLANSIYSMYTFFTRHRIGRKSNTIKVLFHWRGMKERVLYLWSGYETNAVLFEGKSYHNDEISYIDEIDLDEIPHNFSELIFRLINPFFKEFNFLQHDLSKDKIMRKIVSVHPFCKGSRLVGLKGVGW